MSNTPISTGVYSASAVQVNTPFEGGLIQGMRVAVVMLVSCLASNALLSKPIISAAAGVFELPLRQHI